MTKKEDDWWFIKIPLTQVTNTKEDSNEEM